VSGDTLTIRLSWETAGEHGWWVLYCPELELQGQGCEFYHAMQMLMDEIRRAWERVTEIPLSQLETPDIPRHRYFAHTTVGINLVEAALNTDCAVLTDTALGDKIIAAIAEGKLAKRDSVADNLIVWQQSAAAQLGRCAKKEALIEFFKYQEMVGATKSFLRAKRLGHKQDMQDAENRMETALNRLGVEITT